MMFQDPWAALTTAIFGYILAVLFLVVLRPNYETMMPRIKRFSEKLNRLFGIKNSQFLNKKGWRGFYLFLGILFFVESTAFMGVFIYLLAK